MNYIFRKIFITYIVVTLILSCNLTAKENLSKPTSVQWIESDEYSLLCYQIYQSAKKNLLQLDSNSSFSAIIEQKSVNDLPSAVIIDIDETVLLNLPMRNELINKNETFTLDFWKKHIEAKTAVAVNGSKDYLLFAARNGIKVIYISNRLVESEAKTFELLNELGYPVDNQNNILLRNEKKEWTDNKSSRRKYISEKYRVIQIIGDNLRDFTETNQQAIKYQSRFGTAWFLLPNPIYGNWQTFK